MRHELIGSYPPPLGGVSVFLYRRQQQLMQRGDRVVMIDHARMNRFRRMATLLGILFDPRPRAFDLNSVNFPITAALVLRFLPSTVTFRDHGWRFHDGVDLYGFDLCIALVDEIRKDQPEAGLLLALAQVGHSTYLAKLQDEIARRGLGEYVHFMTGQRELWPLLKKASLLVRPTNTDGDAVSIREALHFGCPVVARDVVGRPEGTVLFASRNLGSLVAATKRVLSAGCAAR